MPQFAATDVAALEGKFLAVAFWATWCLPCREDLPLLDREV